MTTIGKPQGFAAMSKEQRSTIARLGGQAAHKYGKAHKWDSESAAKAGRIGGRISRRKPKSSGNTTPVTRG